jgi:hypothetical protein
LLVVSGQWRGLEVAIKTVIFQSSQHEHTTSAVASEAAIATNLTHSNVVATYSHDICNVTQAGGAELDIYKFYLIQVRLSLRTAPEILTICRDTYACTEPSLG